MARATHVGKNLGPGFYVGSTLGYLVMGIFALLTIYPIVWLGYSSLKAGPEIQADPIGLPLNPSFDNYPEVTKAQQDSSYGGALYFLNSLIYAFAGTGLIIVFSFLAGFAFAKIPQKSANVLYNSFLAGILLTLQAILVPLYVVFANLNLVGTHLSILIVYVGIGLPTAVYMGTEYIKGIPTALIESARIDGAGFYRIFFQIILPMTKPLVVTLMILNITGIWNEFTLMLVMGNQDSYGIQAALQKFAGSRSSNYGLAFAALMIGLLPMLLFYVIFQKNITRGVAAGAVKG